VGPRAGLDRCGKSRPPTGIRSLDRPARSQSLNRLSYRTHKLAALKLFNSIIRSPGTTVRIMLWFSDLKRPEEGGSIFLRMLGNHPPGYIVKPQNIQQRRCPRAYQYLNSSINLRSGCLFSVTSTGSIIFITTEFIL